MFNYLALNLAISGAAPIDGPRLLDIFWSACAEGSVKFREGEAHKREFGDLPFWVRQYYRGVKKLVSVYQLGEQETAYLVFSIIMMRGDMNIPAAVQWWRSNCPWIEPINSFL
ncbi:hypothetical protein [Sphingopyxis sp. BSNA05]|uniref:hypothetical protein n=1 Tax=Sphingopyxis sp. BSNA05 TaxID=1236614 RepID=UPI0015635121|nr:hypothetical protein [Sphingopyxis sp. BSNA05]